LSQFVRSIRSFDTRYDEGRAQAGDDRTPFPDFTAQENYGKDLFVLPPNLDEQNDRIGGGLGCAGCHRPPEFDIDPDMQNNGVIGTIDGTGPDFFVTRAPTLRNVVKADGTTNGPLMHTGDFTLDDVLDHYNQVGDAGNTNLDPRLKPQGIDMTLHLTMEEREAVKAFLRTLAGDALYTDPKWSDPFPGETPR
jgi:cytochrome c peroxidase